VAQEVSSIDTSTPSDQGIITNQRKIETKVLASDGEIVVLGGLIDDQYDKGESRVPILGRIPLLGRLFRSDNSQKRRTNLLVFLKVSVIRDIESLSEITAEKYEYVRGQQLKQRNQGFLRPKDKRWPVLPEMSHYNLMRSSEKTENLVVTPSAAEAVEDAEHAE
jgi:general secretion pathway protein D